MGALILRRAIRAALALAAFAGLSGSGSLLASEGEKAVVRSYVPAPPAPASQSWSEVEQKNDGCLSCPTKTDAGTMHRSPAVTLGCVDCHGGNGGVKVPAIVKPNTYEYRAYLLKAHVLPRYPKSWNWPSSANPKRGYTLLNKEAPEYIRFVNPSDYRVAREACGACHIDVITAAERSLMSTGAMLWGGAAYNNGIVPYKNYLFGEAYTKHGEPAKIVSPGEPMGTVTDAQKARGALAEMYPLPT